MALPQRISSVRRSYNQLVADEMLEDYALRFTAQSARKFSARRIANTAFGATSFLALEAIGGGITLQYGTVNAVAAILAVGLLIAVTAGPIAYVAARAGVDIDLLTRAAGFGYIGSTITSLIYASFTFIFFAIEASIFAGMLELVFGIPLWLGYILSAAGIIPLVAFGITFISRFQAWTQPFWLVLNFLPLAYIAAHPALLQGWRHFPGALGHPGFALLPFGICASVVASLLAQIGEQVDYLRFLPRPAPGGRLRWWAALIFAGPGWVVPGMVKALAGSVLAVLALHAGYGMQAGRPAAMYQFAYGLFLPAPLALAAAASLVAVAQTKINVTNAYAGSIAWSNFFSRLTHHHPGRVVWLVFNVAVALLLMELGIYRSIEPLLAFYSVLACAWVGAIFTDLVLVKGLRLGPRDIEFKRAHLYDINPVGTGAMALATLAGAIAVAGLLGPFAQAFAPFLAFAASFCAVPLIAWVTRGRYYLARKPRRAWQGRGPRECGVCGNAFEPRDVAYCPAYAAPICSLCCTLDSRCHDACKPHARYTAQIATMMRGLLPASLRGRMDPVLLRFLGVFGLAALLLGLILAGLYWQSGSLGQTAPDALLATTLWRAFICLSLVAGVFAWLQVLAREASRAAEEESRRQTQLLLAEIEAHRRTDAKLARARAVAEAANLAKTRFIVSVSHELRTPLNAVLGYAQLLEHDETIPAHRREAMRIIRRGAEHMQGLIEGLMDISKIEAGRIEIERREVRLMEFLAQIADMFRLQAAAKGLDFRFEHPARLPASVFTDEIRLRQVLINLLSNALKFTASGHIAFILRAPGEVMEFEIADTGPGIAPGNLERIFEPFERVAPPSGMAPAQGIGLGLTITKLLVEILGGRISVESTQGLGSRFLVRLRLPAAAQARPASALPRRITGYDGPRRTIIAAEDNPSHRALLRDALTPAGFLLLTAPDGPSCLRLAREQKADLFLLDLTMPLEDAPEFDGLALARALREGGHAATPIVILSAHAPQLRPGPDAPYDDVLAKPVDILLLFETIGRRLGLSWQSAAPPPAAPPPDLATGRAALRPHIEQLRYLAGIGFIRGLQECLARVAAEEPAAQNLSAALHALVESLRLPEFLRALEEIDDDAP